MPYEWVALGLMFTGALCLLGAAYTDPESYEAHAEDNYALVALALLLLGAVFIVSGIVLMGVFFVVL